MTWQVVTAVDPFGYYAEGIQQGLDDAFKTRLTAASPYGYHTPPEGSPSAASRPVSAPRPSIRSSADILPLKDRPLSAPPVPEAAVEEPGVLLILQSLFCDSPSHSSMQHNCLSLLLFFLPFCRKLSYIRMLAGVKVLAAPDPNGTPTALGESAASEATAAAETAPPEETPASEEQPAGPPSAVAAEDAEAPAQADGDIPQPTPVAIRRPATAEQVKLQYCKSFLESLTPHLMSIQPACSSMQCYTYARSAWPCTLHTTIVAVWLFFKTQPFN